MIRPFYYAEKIEIPLNKWPAIGCIQKRFITMIPGFNGFTDGRCRQGDEEGVDSHAAGRRARARYEQGLEIKQIIHWEGLDSGK